MNKEVGMKLVRDGIPDIYYSVPEGLVQEFVIVGPASVEPLLIEKIIEEAGELGETLNDSDEEEFKKEAADLLEAFYELLKRRRVPFDEVNRVRLEKRREKGGFEKGVLLITTEVKEE